MALTLLGRRQLAQSETMSPSGVRQLAQRRLEDLLRFASSRSNLYAKRLSPRSIKAPLEALPPLTRSELISGFDDILTDHSVSAALARAEVDLRRSGRAQPGRAQPGRAWRHRWWLAATAGTTGDPAVFIWSRREWATVLASYARAMRWAEVTIGPRSQLRMALVSTSVPTHQSAVVGASIRVPFVQTLTLDARSALERQVERLNGFQPRVLVGYASALRKLALAQLAGELHVHPDAVMSASEVLTAPTAALLGRAWGRPPFDVYAATETAGIASMCTRGSRHLYSDLVVVEPVNADGSPTPLGTLSHHTLVTVLFSRTLPLIRYEMSDRIRLLDEPCDCGLPYPRIGELGGRAENTLLLPGDPDQSVQLDVDALGPIIEAFPVLGWQAAVRGDALALMVVPGLDLDEEALTGALRRHLAQTGTPASVSLRRVEAIPRTGLGKRVPIERP